MTPIKLERSDNSGFKSQTKAQLDHRNMKEIKDFLMKKDNPGTSTNLSTLQVSAQKVPMKKKKVKNQSEIL